MAAPRYDILIEEGATFYKVLTVRKKAVPATPPNAATGDPGSAYQPPVPIDLTGQVITGSIKASYLEGSPVIANFSCSLIDAVNGKIGIELPASVTAGLVADADKNGVFSGNTLAPVTIGFYDIEALHTVSGFVTKVLRGSVQYQDEITTGA